MYFNNLVDKLFLLLYHFLYHRMDTDPKMESTNVKPKSRGFMQYLCNRGISQEKSGNPI